MLATTTTMTITTRKTTATTLTTTENIILLTIKALSISPMVPMKGEIMWTPGLSSS
jgi:hypothetical protein